jgi:hypothetical protein
MVPCIFVLFINGMSAATAEIFCGQAKNNLLEL